MVMRRFTLILAGTLVSTAFVHAEPAEHGTHPHSEGKAVAEAPADEPVEDSTKAPVKREPRGSAAGAPRVVINFSRFESRLLALCDAITLDGRRERMAAVATFGSKNTSECGSCRSLWRTLERVCRIKEPKKPKPSKKAKEEEPVEEPEATPTPRPQTKQRHPSGLVIDLASRLSTSMFEGERDGMMKESVDRVTDMLERYGSPTPGEQEYFGILRAYLMGAWQGREELPKEELESEHGDPTELFE